MQTGLSRQHAQARVAAVLRRLSSFPCGAAIKAEEQLQPALASRVEVVFILRGDGLLMAPVIKRIHAAGKLAAIHLDLVDGLAPDHAGVHWLARSGADAIITSHSHAVRAIRAEGVVAVQRLLVGDRNSLESGLAAAGRSRPDIVELLPGVILPHIHDLLLPRLEVPLLAGGFIRTRADVEVALAAGALAVTTSTSELWT